MAARSKVDPAELIELRAREVLAGADAVLDTVTRCRRASRAPSTCGRSPGSSPTPRRVSRRGWSCRRRCGSVGHQLGVPGRT